MIWLRLEDDRTPGLIIELPLDPGRYTFGRDEANDIPLAGPEISRLHLLLTVGHEVAFTDLGSRNGLELDGKVVTGGSLGRGQPLQVGRYQVTWIEAPAPLPLGAEAAHRPEPDRNAVPRWSGAFLSVSDLTTGDRTVFKLQGERTVLGRQADCDVPLLASGVSRNHAAISRRGAYYVLEDLGSRNGVLVSGRRVRSHRLAAGDSFRIGPFELVFGQAPQRAPIATERPA